VLGARLVLDPEFSAASPDNPYLLARPHLRRTKQSKQKCLQLPPLLYLKASVRRKREPDGRGSRIMRRDQGIRFEIGVQAEGGGSELMRHQVHRSRVCPPASRQGIAPCRGALLSTLTNLVDAIGPGLWLGVLWFREFLTPLSIVCDRQKNLVLSAR